MVDRERVVLTGEQLCECGLWKTPNPIHGSGWFIQIVSKRSLKSWPLNPTNGSWWMFKFFLKDLNYPPTAVGGITSSF